MQISSNSKMDFQITCQFNWNMSIFSRIHVENTRESTTFANPNYLSHGGKQSVHASWLLAARATRNMPCLRKRAIFGNNPRLLVARATGNQSIFYEIMKKMKYAPVFLSTIWREVMLKKLSRERWKIHFENGTCLNLEF